MATTTRPRLVLAICCISLLIVGMDATIVNIALPAIQDDFNASVSELQWSIAAYTVALASLLMLSGSTADRLGRARIFQLGLVLFTVASLACALAPSIGLLIAFRALQGVGASMLNPVAMGIIRNTFVDPRERAQAIGIWGAVFGISMALGPVVGGLLVPISWRAVFLVNIPIGMAAWILTKRYIPESRAPHARRIDPVGQVLAVTFLSTLTASIIEGPNLGWTSVGTIALAAVAVVSLAAFILYELRRHEPLIELRFFESRPFASATGIAVIAFAALGGFLFVNTLYLQEVRGLSPVIAGLCTLPMAAAIMLISPISGRVTGKHGVRGPLMLGGLGVLVGSLMLVTLSADTPILWLLLAYTIFGAGFGGLNPPITNTAVSGMPAAQAGVAAAVASTSRIAGQTLGVAIFGSVATAGIAGSISEDLAAASHAAWWLIAGSAVVVIGLGFVASTTAARSSAEHIAARLQGAP
jgi:EmrB/QacA subfamily drug resistance transporter